MSNFEVKKHKTWQKRHPQYIEHSTLNAARLVNVVSRRFFKNMPENARFFGLPVVEWIKN